jgi:tight adherence protein B
MSPSLAPLIYVIAFVVVVLLIQVIASVVFSVGDASRRVNRRLTMLQSGMKGNEVYSALVRKSAAPKVSSPFLLRLHDHVDKYCRQAGLSVTPVRLLAIAVVGAGVLWLISLLVLHSAGGPGVLLNSTVSMIGSAVLSLGAVWFWLNNRRNARMKKIEAQMPLALDIVNRAVRAGHPVVSAVQLAADEMGDPIGSEFGLIVDETTYGAEFKEALTSFAHRTGSADAHFFAVSIAIQSETGGNLAEILEGLAAVIRARATLAMRVKALASEGKASAVVLSILPIFLVAILFLFHPQFYTDKFKDPVFWPVAGCIAVVYIIGLLIIRRIINFKY